MKINETILEELEKYEKVLFEYFNQPNTGDCVTLQADRSFEKLAEVFSGKLDNLYCIYLKENNDWIAVYIGHSKDTLFFQRMRQHFIGYAGTGSKYEKLKGANEIRVKSIRIEPVELRQYFEQKLIASPLKPSLNNHSRK
ncbi:MAG TPA: hypothetical protein PL084_12225 [Chitinophagales bacterium]|nr:hypothetical protein [Chitinophagales bacterium]HRP40456.1 hypothetical protein [Chitinophagales bacterium]